VVTWIRGELREQSCHVAWPC